MVNNSTNIKKTKIAPSYLFEHKKDRHNDVGNPVQSQEILNRPVFVLRNSEKVCTDSENSLKILNIV
jgi:hypothetical protein